jgi:hypothetical protein
MLAFQYASHYQESPADERVQIQQGELLSREAVYACVNTLHWCLIS